MTVPNDWRDCRTSCGIGPRVPEGQRSHAGRLMVQYCQLPTDLAAVALLLAQHLRRGRVPTTDRRDVGDYRWKARKPFVERMAQA